MKIGIWQDMRNPPAWRRDWTGHYRASIDQYTYVWKTDHEWTGSCRKLIVRLVDGTDHVAYFSFIE